MDAGDIRHYVALVVSVVVRQLCCHLTVQGAIDGELSEVGTYNLARGTESKLGVHLLNHRKAGVSPFP